MGKNYAYYKLVKLELYGNDGRISSYLQKKLLDSSAVSWYNRYIKDERAVIVYPWNTSLATYLNLSRERDVSNTDRQEYNCGGFALETFSWYIPYDGDDYFELVDYYDEDLSLVTEHCVNHMLNEVPGLRLINAVSDARKDEKVVLFRVGPTDFHYVKYEDGEYLHKIGSTPIMSMSEEEVYSRAWCYGKYNGEIVIFALKPVDGRSFLKKVLDNLENLWYNIYRKVR